MGKLALESQLEQLADAKIAAHSSRFFKTGAGQYGEGDCFLGIRVPVIRAELKRHRKTLTLDSAVRLLHSRWHEVRLFAVLALVDLYNRSRRDGERRAVVQAYLKHRARVNNWDLVDSSAPGITGAWYYSRNRARIDRLIEASSLWDRRIAVLSTLYYIRQSDCDDTFNYARLCLTDEEDLIHKACGWMLREAGKRDIEALHRFLDGHAVKMPRTMLRYAIEKLPEARRRAYLQAR